MPFVFASSHLPEDNRPQEEDEEEDVQPMQRSGMVRALSHLPQPVQGAPAAPRPSAPSHLPSWATEPPETEHEPEAEADTDSHGAFEPPATVAGDTHGAIGPASPRGAAPPAGRSLFLTPRPMPPEYARQQATTYGAAPNNRGNASNSGYASPLGSGDQPGTTAPGTRPLTVQGVLDQGRIAQEKANEILGKGSQTEAEANPTVDRGNASNSSNLGSGAKPAATGPGSEIQSAQDLIDKARNRYNPDLAEAERTFETRLDKQQEIRQLGDPARDALTRLLRNNQNRQEFRKALQTTGYSQDLAKTQFPKGVDTAFDFGNERLGLAPDVLIKKLDGTINKTKALIPEHWEEAERASVALRPAEQETQEAGMRWNKLKAELAKKQKQPPGQP